MMKESLTYLTTEQQARIASVRIGIAGAGGLGSNIAVMLARSGVCSFLIIDDDIVEPSNLNRQHYFPRHLGMPKVEALSSVLHELDPAIRVEALRLRMDSDNLPGLMPEADFWIEAVDGADLKRVITSAAASSGKTVFCGSGMGGFGGRAMKRRILRHAGGLIVITGDFSTDIAQAPPLAPRVIQCAAMQADAALEYILTGTVAPLS